MRSWIISTMACRGVQGSPAGTERMLLVVQVHAFAELQREQGGEQLLDAGHDGGWLIFAYIAGVRLYAWTKSPFPATTHPES